MSKTYSPLARRVIFCLLILLLLGLCIGLAKAQSLGSLNSRVSRLESENAHLRGRITRLENQLRNVGRTKPSGGTEQLTLPPSSPSPSIDDPMFDRLATLVIELKERMNALENRLDALERQR
jgi:outer membrane murein-binding lipoprotein Lpp